MDTKPLYYGYLASPIGLIEVCADEEGLHGVSFVEKMEQKDSNLPFIKEATQQLQEYFEGLRTVFNLKCHFSGTEFQKKVWHQLTLISYGETVNYGEVALRIGNPKASRAVGGANNKNKLAIVVPCHRVIGKKGELVGYAGELWRKESLLKLESQNNA